jgi:hypothetical protein
LAKSASLTVARPRVRRAEPKSSNQCSATLDVDPFPVVALGIGREHGRRHRAAGGKADDDHLLDEDRRGI